MRPEPDPANVTPLSAGWRLYGTEPGALSGPEELGRLEAIPATVPGTVAGALVAAGRTAEDCDERDWWFATEIDLPAAGERRRWLCCEGVATLSEIFVGGERVAVGESMFERRCLPLPSGAGPVALAICCRALAPRLRERRRPRARWRTRLVEGNLRFYRTMLLGRAPGFAPGPPVIGPWRPVTVQESAATAPRELRLRARLASDGGGVVSLTASFHTAPAAVTLVLSGAGATVRAPLTVEGDRAGGELRIEDPRRWWPHTHGEPFLYTAELEISEGEQVHRVPAGRLGFRELTARGELERDGLALSVNGTPVFCRGAVWTPPDLLAPHADAARLRDELQRMVAAGMNMVRIAGIGAYETAAFHDLCDELGLLVWQDVMLANLDYPEADPSFMAAIEHEVTEMLAALGPRPSLAVVCGGSEVAQQVAMMGLDPALASGPLYGELLPGLVHAAGVDAVYVPSTPWGGTLPFRPDRGVANYYGVGAYLRPLTDARLAGVRFAAECLAFANVPDAEALAELGEPPVHDPRWKAGVPRDVGAGWDFDDVRDHYLKLLYEVDPVTLRGYDPERYLELSRAVSGEVMAEVLGEWRREASPCAGALLLWSSDLRPGAGWGVLDHRGRPKAAYHHVRRALAPVAVWTTDEGLGGIAVHVANDAPAALRVRVRIALYRDFEILVQETERELELAGAGSWEADVEALLGRFVDAAWAYRFGPPGQDLIVASLQDGDRVLAQAFRFPAGRPQRPAAPGQLGLSGRISETPAGPVLRVRSTAYAHGVRVVVPGFAPSDDAFGVEPGHERSIALAPDPGAGSGEDPHLTALNLQGRVRIERG